MGTPPPNPIRPRRDTSVDERLIYETHKAIPVIDGDTPPFPDRPLLQHIVNKSGRSVQEDWAYYVSRTPIHWIGQWFVDFWHAFINFFAPTEPDFTDVFPLKSNVITPSPYGRKREYGPIPFYPYRNGYQPLPTLERGEPPRSISAIVPVSIFEQMDRMIEALKERYNVGASEHYFALSPEYYRIFWRESVLQMRYVGDLTSGTVQYHGVPVIECAEVISGIILRPRGGQSNTALLALIKTIEAEIASRHATLSPLLYAPCVEDEPIISECQHADDGKASVHDDGWEQLLILERG